MRKTTDCLFIFSPGSKSQDNRRFDYHLGSSYIIAYLRSKGFNAQQFIQREPVTLNECIKRILDYRPRIAGFTVYDANFNISALIAGQLKKVSPSTLIVFGGPCPSVHSDFIMSTYSFVDMCFLNDSEETFLQLITKLSEKKFDFKKADLTGFKGISYRYEETYSKPEKHIFHDNSGSVNYLDRYPSPYLGGIIPASEGYTTGLVTARGCNQNCVYCNCAVLSGRRFYTHSVDRVIRELDFISKHPEGKQILTFHDDAFTLIPHRAEKICNAIIENKINIRLGCITRCDCVDEALLDRMKEAGFVSIGFSLESANPATLRRIGKIRIAEDRPSYNLEKEIRFIESFDRFTAYAKKIGIKSIIASIMVGLPGETVKDARQTIDAIDRNKNIDLYTHNFLTIFKGTPLFADYRKYGYKLKYINNNPIFTKLTYPADLRKIYISTKSTLHQIKKYSDKSTLGILSFTSANGEGVSGVRNIILQADHVQPGFVKWLKDVLILNGTIIQIYSCEKALTSLTARNYKIFLKYSSPSLNIRNYCFSETSDGLLLLSSHSLLLKTDNIKVCDFEYFRSKLNDPDVNFIKTLCREANHRDSVTAFSFLRGISRVKEPFLFLTGKRAMPYFANLCKWTRDLANCVNRNTLIINEKNEIRFCWYGDKTGSVGQSYDEIIRRLESEKNVATTRRKCSQCKEENNCIKCPFPFPLTETEYCINKKSTDLNKVPELIISLDQFKQILE